MTKQKSLGINAVLNVLRTILALIVPLLTYPYVCRILGAENLGSVDYTNSIIQYFVLFSGLGISTYGIREGAKKRDNLSDLSEFISECYTINLVFTGISYIALLVLLFFFRNKTHYFPLFCIQSALILFNTIGIEWVNTVFEDYLYITIRTIIIQILNVCLIFLLIHQRSDYIMYSIVTVSTTGLISLLNWFHYRKKISIKVKLNIHWYIHIKPILLFFTNKLAVTLYVSADKTMLGALIGDYSVGIYSAAVKIYTIIKNLLSAVYAVFLPRLAYVTSTDDKERFKKIYSSLISIMTLFILPVSVGLLALSKHIILLLFGEEYITASLPLAILSIAILFAIYGGLISAVYDIVTGQEKVALQATIIAATLNIGINWFILPYYKEAGAAITTLLAELVTFVFCLFRSEGIKQYIDIRIVMKNLFQAIIGCIEIFVLVKLAMNYCSSPINICVLSIMCSLIVYFITLGLLKNSYILACLRKARTIINPRKLK